MKNKIDYFDLDRHFVLPKHFMFDKVINPFYKDIKRLSRRVKKDLKKLSVYNSKHLTLPQKLWYKLNVENPDYVRFLIKKICEYYEQKEETKPL